MICGLILAGGRASRFGREKAMADLGGRPLIDWAAEALAADIDLIAVNAKTTSGAASYACGRGWPVVPDAEGADALQGPLAGVLAGLCWAQSRRTRWLCTAPCDTPFLPVDVVRRLLAGANGAGAVARTTDGLQALVALWPVAELERIGRLHGRNSPKDVLSGLGAAPVDFADARAFANLNTPADYAAAEAAARGVR